MASNCDHGTKIWAISSDLFNIVSSYLSGGSIIDLWCSGDTKLQYIMVNGGIKSIKFVDEGTATTSRFPQFLRFFRRLSSVSFYRPQDMLDKIDVVRDGLQSLPPTLEKLSLRFCSAECVLLDSTVDISSFYGSNSNSEHVDHSSKPSKLWSLSHYFPNLRFFEVESLFGASCLEDEDILHFPSSLTNLRLLSRDKRLTTAMFKYLKPQLVNLSFGAWTGALLTHEELALLPSHIESFEWHGAIYGNAFPSIPSTLTHIELPRMRLSRTQLDFVPKSLKSILVAQSQSSGTMYTDKIPRHITKLTLFMPGEAWNQPDFLPPGLIQCCSLRHSHLISAIKWPETMTSLELGTVSFELGDCPIPLLSDGSELPHGGQPLGKLLATFPKGLRDLSIRNIQEKLGRKSPSFDFPFMTRLVLGGQIRLSKSLLKQLPRTLKVLSLQPKYVEEKKRCGNSWFQYLPSQLEMFEFKGSMAYGINMKCFSCLPSGLKELSVDVDGHAKFEDLKALPRSLTALYLNDVGSMGCGANGALPPRLKRLELRYLKEGLDLLNLPPKLTYLEAPLWNGNLLPSHIVALPHYLHHLDVRRARFQETIPKGFQWPLALDIFRFRETRHEETEIDIFLSRRSEAYRKGNFSTPDPRIFNR